MNVYPYEEMIQRDIDGALSAEEHDHLAQYLRDHADARTLHKQLKSVDLALSEEPWVEPPATLRANVMRSIKQADSSPIRRPAARTTLFQPILDMFRVRPGLTFGVGVAAGIIALMPLAGRFADSDLVPVSQVSGTMISDQAWPSGEMVDEFVFTEGDIEGSVRLGVLAGRAIVTAAVTSAQSVEMEFGFELRQLSLAGFLSQGSDQIQFEATRDVLKASHSGKVEYQLAFDRPGLDISTLTVNITSNSRPVVSGSLSIGSE